jgi:uroporphyrinogen-III synthase
MSSYEIKNLKRKQHPLGDQRVLLTRAGSDNDSLAHTLRKLGAVVIVQPCLQVELFNPEQLADQLPIDPPDGIIFTSRYAVRAVAEHWPNHLRHSTYYAIGPSTGAEMDDTGLPSSQIAQPASTDGLLTQLTNIKQQNWLILGGKDPRPLLQDSLLERGAVVDFVACYERFCPYYSSESLQRLVEEGITTTVIQSMSCLKNLAHLLKDSPDHPLWQTDVVVPTERYCPSTKALGFCGKVIVAGSADDAAIVQALQGISHEPGNNLPE